MNQHQAMVREFMERRGQGTPDKPTLSYVGTHHLRYKLIAEELKEYGDACYTNDLLGIADAIADLLYVVYGTAVAHGIDIEPIFAEVHRSNMTKPVNKYREDGKILKDENYQPPDIEGTLRGQME